MANPTKTPAEVPLPPLDPHTARCLREIKEVCRAIESGEFGVLEFADAMQAEPRLTRSVRVQIGFNGRKA